MFARTITTGLIAGLVVLTVSATTLERLSLDTMVGKSTAIVRAQVIGTSSESRNGSIYTRYTLQVSETWKGSAGTKVDVFVPGGTLNGLRQSVPGAPVLDSADDLVIFLWKGASGRMQVIGLSQGLFYVNRDDSGVPMIERPGVKELMIDGQTGRAVQDVSVRMPLGEMKTRVVTRVAEMQAGN